MRARAAISTDWTQASGRTRVSRLRSQAPLMLRPTIAKDAEAWIGDRHGAARVCLTAGAAGPIGGDEFFLDVEVGAGSTLVLRDVSATLLLPGPHDEQSSVHMGISVRTGGSLVWLPEPLIVAKSCRHLNDVRVDLEEGAGLIMREEMLLGRHGEEPGSLIQSVRVRHAGRPLYHQRLDLGPEAAGWKSPAIAADRRAVGSVLIVDPVLPASFADARLLGTDAAILPINRSAVLVTALANDSLTLRRILDAGLEAVSVTRAFSPTARPRAR